MSWADWSGIFAIVGVVCCVVWAYVLVAVVAYASFARLAYPFERLRYAAAWPVSWTWLLARAFRRLRRRRHLPKAKVNR